MEFLLSPTTELVTANYQIKFTFHHTSKFNGEMFWEIIGSIKKKKKH